MEMYPYALSALILPPSFALEFVTATIFSLQVPLRFHTRPSVLRNAHIVPQRELLCGLQDCLPDDQSNTEYRSHDQEYNH